MKKRILYCLSLMFLTAVARAQAPVPPSAMQAPENQPVFILLYSRITDHVNLDISEAQLRALLPMAERIRKEHPQAHLSVALLFSGAMSDALDKRNAQNHLKDLVLDYQKRGVIEIGYDGSDEPTYEHRPAVRGIEDKPYRDRWLLRASEDEKFLTEGRDPLTGEPRPGAVGGLARMQAVFGKAAWISGISVGEQVPAPPDPKSPGNVSIVNRPEVGDWEAVPVLRRYNTDAILFGLPATNVAHIAGFRGSVAAIGHELSPAPNTSPEVFWADNVLRSSESGGTDARVLHGFEGVGPVKEFTTKLDRSRMRIIHMELVSESDFLQPDFAKSASSAALKYAYSHPTNPALPADSRVSKADANAVLAKEEEALNWLTSDYFQANVGSRFISSSDLRRMTPPSSGYFLRTALLQDSIKSVLKAWGNNTFTPSYFSVDSHYLSLAEMFQVLTDALAELNRTGKLPESVKVGRISGPLVMATGHGPNAGEVKVADVAAVCAKIASGLHDDSGYPLPTDAVPSILEVNSIGVNAAQFLHLMAEAIVDPLPQKTLRVAMTYMLPATAQMFPKTRALQDTGATWTFKPAPLQSGLIEKASR
jgi:hypothetical protein